MRCRLVLPVLLAAVVVLVPVVAAAPVQAQTGGDSTVTTIGAEDAPGIIPRPDSGVAPDDAGDRGGALQATLLVVIVGGMVTIGALALRQSRRARAARGF